MKNRRIVNLIHDKINKIKDFSGVIKIKKDGKVIFYQAYGFADIANERKNNINTRFGIASGAKLLTAISICILVDQGKLNFDSLINQYIDDYKFNRDITVKHLLTHTSGIPEYYDEEVVNAFSELWIDNPMYLMSEPKDFIDLMKKQKTLFKPGENFHYNNGGYVVLAYIVERISGMKFRNFVKENILDVLNMNSSGYFRMDMLPENCAYGYEITKNGALKTNIYSIPIIGGGDGGIFITADDMSRLWHGLIRYMLFSKKTTDELLSMQVHAYENIYYGYGLWMKKKNDSVYKYYISGSDPGVQFISELYPKDELELTILGNREFETSEIIDEIEKLYYVEEKR